MRTPRDDEAVPPELRASPPRPSYRDEELDKVADAAVGHSRPFSGFRGRLGDVEEYEGDEGEIILDVVGGDSRCSSVGTAGRSMRCRRSSPRSPTGGWASATPWSST